MEALKLKPYKYQEEGIEYALKHHYSINGFEMGLGKSLCAISVAVKESKYTLVVCPSSLKLNWAQEICKSVTLPQAVLVVEKKSELIALEKEVLDYDFIIINYEMLDKAGYLFKWANMVIADEVHYLKNVTAQRTKFFHDFLDWHRPNRFLGLSGTPIKNRVTEWFSPMVLCSYNPHKTSGHEVHKIYKSPWSFNERFCQKKRLRLGRRSVVQYYGVQNIGELRMLLKDKYIRKEAEGNLELPPIVTKNIDIKALDFPDLKEAWEAHLNGAKSTSISTAKATAALAKAPHTAKYCQELLDAGEGPLIVFSDHLKPVAKIVKELKAKKFRVDSIVGADDTFARQATVNKFQAGKLDVLVATIGSTSTGFTLTRARNMVFNDISWVPADMRQAMKRIHRIGQTKKCVIHFILGSKMDALIVKTNEEKMEVLEKTL